MFCGAAAIILCGLIAKPRAEIIESSDKKHQVITSKHIEVILLNALPGSGKSEVRRYLSLLDPAKCRQKFGIATMVQIDDFPYVYMMRRVSDELRARGHEGAFFLSAALPFRDCRDWGTLTHLINADYSDLVRGIKFKPRSAAEWLFNRIDAARAKVGADAVFNKMPKKLRREIAKAVEVDAVKLLKEKNEEIDKAQGLPSKTVVIEFSRGGADSSPMPLPAPYGYKYSYEQLSSEILEKASILYLWVSPEESRRKNEARANPNDPGSILNHCVPRAVMYTEYGCDDIEWLLSVAKKPGTVSIKAHDKIYDIPLGRFDNRIDRTTFTHADPSAWHKKDVRALHAALTEAFSSLMR
jgi:hypothetical protein